MNTRRNNVAIIHRLYRRNKSSRIGGGHVGVYAADTANDAIIRAANAKQML
ncbi:MAG: hypothetical protein FWC70_11175 [Defluviitaleaceae bacterium]|nr:hypothetical protein [Defluviitaleaceae bacterium]